MEHKKYIQKNNFTFFIKNPMCAYLRKRIIFMSFAAAIWGCDAPAQNQPKNPSNSPYRAHTRTANDSIKPYKGAFRYGSNMGWYPPYTDEKLADLAAGNPTLGVEGVGINALRPALPNHFLERWGYDARLEAFAHYGNLGMTENVAFIGYPAPQFRDNTVYCGKDTSALFANMYEPIWDNGENGTPINDRNHCALYLWKTVNKYRQNVRFWEVWNEPDYAVNTYNNEAPATTPKSWWNVDPAPCEFALHAPIQHYIRLLRISYEVIKKVDPNAYVMVGGIGFPSFLDAILRNTDNPEEGLPTPQYPLGGGAYFDILSYHSYPHIDGSVREWSNFISGFNYFRHSDRAVAGIFKRKKDFQNVLEKYGYNGKRFPQKLWMITESNIPRRRFGEFMGSDEAQRNFLMKALAKAQEENIIQFHVYSLGELEETHQAKAEFDVMGLYEKLTGKNLFSSPVTEGGIAYRTMSRSLAAYRFDAAETKRLQERVGEKSDGIALRHASGNLAYCLWAKTEKDLNETANTMLTLPALGTRQVEVRSWDWSLKPLSRLQDSREVMLLNGTPQIFIALPSELPTAPKTEGCEPIQIKDTLYLLLKSDENTFVSVEMFDINTHQRLKIVENAACTEGGEYLLQVPISRLKKGLHFIEGYFGKRKWTKKIVIK